MLYIFFLILFLNILLIISVLIAIASPFNRYKSILENLKTEIYVKINLILRCVFHFFVVKLAYQSIKFHSMKKILPGLLGLFALLFVFTSCENEKVLQERFHLLILL